MNATPRRILLLGYGNPGRCDDGLGPAFAARIEARGLPGLDVFTDYQLTVDHALQIVDGVQVHVVKFGDFRLKAAVQLGYPAISAVELEAAGVDSSLLVDEAATYVELRG